MTENSIMTDYCRAHDLMGEDFIGVEELRHINKLRLLLPSDMPDVPFTEKELRRRSQGYLLILGVSRFENGNPITIRNIKALIGQSPDADDPCFYNQDWYEKEAFIDLQMPDGWYFIRKSIYEESRSVQPEDLRKKYRFPSAISCVYAFFTAWYALNIKLWYHDFVWCSDKDHNGDRIYVGRYHDIDGINRNGFSIHRHLGLRDCYGCID